MTEESEQEINDSIQLLKEDNNYVLKLNMLIERYNDYWLLY